jgi:hypothetical protein
MCPLVLAQGWCLTVKRASGRTKTEAKDKFKEILRDLDDGMTIAPHGYIAKMHPPLGHMPRPSPGHCPTRGTGCRVFGVVGGLPPATVLVRARYRGSTGVAAPRYLLGPDRGR